jgi:cytochrome c oxidase subunit II
MRRRQLLLAVVAGALAGRAAWSQEKVIRIVAKKFEFVPAEITLEKGVPVVLEISAPDVAMGFSAPDFKVDVEIPPGMPVQVRLLPDKAGSFDFICDVFCGDGHEDMAGKIHVA